MRMLWVLHFLFQAEDGIRDLVRSRGLGDVYKRQRQGRDGGAAPAQPGLGGSQLLQEALADGESALWLSLIHI